MNHMQEEQFLGPDPSQYPQVGLATGHRPTIHTSWGQLIFILMNIGTYCFWDKNKIEY